MNNKTVLSDKKIESGREEIFSTNNPFCPCDARTMRKVARWVEQAVLQSPEIQHLRKDAERYRWLKRRLISVDFEYGEPSCTAIVFEIPDIVCFTSSDKNIDAAMEQKP